MPPRHGVLHLQCYFCSALGCFSVTSVGSEVLACKTDCCLLNIILRGTYNNYLPVY